MKKVKVDMDAPTRTRHLLEVDCNSNNSSNSDTDKKSKAMPRSRRGIKRTSQENLDLNVKVEVFSKPKDELTSYKQAKTESTSITVKTEIKSENENDHRPDESDEDLELDADDTFNYLSMRETNIQANKDFLASLNIEKHKMEHKQLVSKKVTATNRGLKLKKEVEPLIRRQSLRQRRMDPTGNSLPEPDPIIEITPSDARLPEGPLPMNDHICSRAKDISVDDVKIFSAHLGQEKRSGFKPVSKNLKNLIQQLDKISINEKRVAKVVPGRVFSVTWHPSPTNLMLAAGDKYGNVGLWNMTNNENDNDSCNVVAFTPHSKPVSHLDFSTIPNKLLSCSYDATLRCGDFQKGVFDEIYSVPEEEDDLCRNFDFIDEGNCMLVSHFRGSVSLVDMRTPGTKAEHSYPVNRKSLRTVSIHPASKHHFITAGIDSNINLYDLRNLSTKSPKSLQTISYHSKAIASAFFSPDGSKILSSSADDHILVSDVRDGMKLEVSKAIRHNNHTGRWLTNFRPSWHPVVEEVFITGSMRRPREIEIYSTDGRIIKSIQDEDCLGSVCSLNAFHPNHECAIVGANSSGRLHVFM